MIMSELILKALGMKIEVSRGPCVVNLLAVDTKNLSINNFSISLPESDEGSSQMRESQVS